MVEKSTLLVGLGDQNCFRPTSDKKPDFLGKYLLQPADAVKNPVSLILVDHPKSDFNTPFILESPSADLVCADAVSTAKSDKGSF